MKRMNSRFVELSAGTLAWYDTDKTTSRADVAPKGKVSIAGGVSARAAPPQPDKQRFGFTVTLGDQQLYFEASTEAECAAWVAALS